MSTINGVSSSNIYELINQNNASDSSTSQVSEDNDMFMQLMIAQLKNQDPTSPTDANSFMEQISTMSMVEGITNLNSQIGSMTTSLMSSQAALQASSLVGRNVFVPADSVTPNSDGAIDGMLELTTSAANVQVAIFDSAGQQVDLVNLGNLAAGSHNFSWQAPDGSTASYTLAATSGDATNPTEEALYLATPVSSVTLGQNGIGMKINTDSGSYALDDVKQISS